MQILVFGFRGIIVNHKRRDAGWPSRSAMAMGTMITLSVDGDAKGKRFGLAPGDLARVEPSDAPRKSIKTNFAEAD
jgi:hypothetical protein